MSSYRVNLLTISLFLKIIHASCQDGVSLAFVIDNTRSMGKIMDEIKLEVENILNGILSEKSHLIQDLILVTFNDPGKEFIIKTSLKNEFLEYLHDIKVYNHAGNDDCPEMSLTGILEALNNSPSGSYIFVFTDASAKDSKRVYEVIESCKRKQAQVFIVTFGDCGNTEVNMVYREIAKTSSGQVFRLSKGDMHRMTDVIKALLLQGNNKSIVLRKEFEASNKGTLEKISLTIDEGNDSVLVSVSGRQVTVYIIPTSYKNVIETTSETAHIKPSTTHLFWNSDIKVTKLSHQKPGNYSVWVRGKGFVSVLIRKYYTAEENAVATDQPSSKLSDMVAPEIISTHTVLVRNKLKAICRVKGVPKPTVTWQLRSNGSGEFHDVTGFNGEELILSEIKPNQTGTYKCVATNIVGNASHYLDFVDAKPETQPKVNITEGSEIVVKYGANVSLTCEVEAFPEPDIYWYNSSKTLLNSKNSQLGISEHASQITLFQVNHNDTYTCKATNNKGSSVANIHVKVRPIFTTISSPPALLNVKYGENVKITCNIKSYLSMNISWFVFDKEISDNDVYSISANRTELSIKHINYKLQGHYDCFAYLVAEPIKKILYSTDIKILGLALPVIDTPINTSTVIMKQEKFELNCKVTQGYPQPRVLWYKKVGDNFTLLESVNEEVFRVQNARLDLSGQYKCEATNVLGVASLIYDVTVKNLPETSIVESKRNFTYGSPVEFTCKVESYATPTVQWIDEKGNILEKMVTQTSQFEYISRLRLDRVKKSALYNCTASNDLGASASVVRTIVASPFYVNQKPNNNITKVAYGKNQTIRCDIRSSLPMTIKWYRQNNDVKSIRHIVHSSDKMYLSSNGTDLIIKSMDSDLRGNYTCEASLNSDELEKVSFHTYVDVIIDNVAAEIVHTDMIVINKMFKAICKVKGIPKPMTTWKFKPTGSKEFHTMSGYDKEKLIVPDIWNHTGVYRCVATNSLGEDYHDFDTSVISLEPKINNEETKYFGLKFDRVLKISCNVTGRPDPVIEWKKDGEVIKNSFKYVTKPNALYIRNLIEQDTGNYTCEAKNDLGTAQKTFEVIVTEGFEKDNLVLIGDTHVIGAFMNSNVSVKCNLINSNVGLNDYTPRWYLNGQFLNHSGWFYDIDIAKNEENVLYTCRVDNNEGAISETYDLQIGYPPEFVYDSPLHTEINWNGDAASLDCTFNSSPRTQIQWIHNGVEIRSQTMNSTQELEIMDWGEYKCIITNALGSIKRTFNVTSTDCYVNEHMVTQNMPLWFYGDMLLWPVSSSSDGISLGAHKSITLVCTSHDESPNSFHEFPTKKNITAECYKENKFIVDRRIYNFSELECSKRVQPSIVNTYKKCMGRGTELLQIGFAVEGFMEAYKICYDTIKNVPLYASNSITKSNAASNHFSNWNNRPWGSCQNATDKCCYMKSQLIHVDSVVFGPIQQAILNDHWNSVAVWIPCKSMSWLEFETVFAARYSENSWVLLTGASEYLHRSDLLIPTFLWKVVKHNGSYTVVVYKNDSFYNDYDENPEPCSSSCNGIDILGSESAQLFDCCTIEEFQTNYNLPEFNDIDILDYGNLTFKSM